MDGETKSLKAFWQDLHEPMRVVFVLKRYDKVVSETYEEAASAHQGLNGLDPPLIQDVIEKNICQQRRYDSSHAKDNLACRRDCLMGSCGE